MSRSEEFGAGQHKDNDCCVQHTRASELHRRQSPIEIERSGGGWIPIERITKDAPPGMGHRGQANILLHTEGGSTIPHNPNTKVWWRPRKHIES